MSDDELHAELRELMAAWLLNDLPDAYLPRLDKVLNETARRGRREGRVAVRRNLLSTPALFDPEVDC